MNKHIIAACMMIVLVLIAACSSRNESGNTSLTEQASGAAETVKNTFKTMSEALASGQQVHCSVTTIINNEKATTEIWSSGKNQRIEMMSSQANMMAIYSEEWIYSWSPDTKQGMKMNMEMVKELQKQSEGANQESVPSLLSTPDLDELSATASDFSCEPTVISQDKFTPPSDVTFQDLTSMMKAASEMQKNMEAGQTPTQEDIEKMQAEYEKMQGESK